MSDRKTVRAFVAGWDRATKRAIFKANRAARHFERLDYSDKPNGAAEVGRGVAIMMRDFAKELRGMLSENQR